MAILTLSPCGCLGLVSDSTVDLFLTDSNLLPSSFLNIGWIKFDSIQYDIDDVFTDVIDLLSYLNTTFVSAYGFDGIFTLSGGFIEYSNIENFETAEIMAIYQTEVYPYLNGTAEAINIPYKATFANLNVITDADLIGKDILSVQVNRQNSEPITANGWLFNSGAGTITFPVDNPPIDSNIYVTLKQTAL